MFDSEAKLKFPLFHDFIIKKPEEKCALFTKDKTYIVHLSKESQRQNAYKCFRYKLKYSNLPLCTLQVWNVNQKDKQRHTIEIWQPGRDSNRQFATRDRSGNN